ncbi:phosphatidyl inositol kinase [Aureococcus anophagefferens]|nr:phosphatidyl inositol kinase [Aureococcus anophagefferens]
MSMRLVVGSHNMDGRPWDASRLATWLHPTGALDAADEPSPRGADVVCVALQDADEGAVGALAAFFELDVVAARRAGALRVVVLARGHLQGFSEPQLARVHEALLVRDYAPDEVIIRQGDDRGEEFYIIVAVLSSGDYFGERAMILNEPRASTRAADAEAGVSCLTLDRESFEEAVMDRGHKARLKAGKSHKRALGESPTADAAKTMRAVPRYEHDANEEATNLLVEYITQYADLLPRTSRGGGETEEDRVAAVARALKGKGDALPDALASELRLLLLEALTPEMSLEDMLERLLCLARGFFDVEATDFYFPVDVRQKKAVLWKPDEKADGARPPPEGATWAGLVRDVAVGGAIVKEDGALGAPVFEARADDDAKKVIAIVALRDPAPFTVLQELALLQLAAEVTRVLRANVPPLDEDHADYEEAADEPEANGAAPKKKKKKKKKKRLPKHGAGDRSELSGSDAGAALPISGAAGGPQGLRVVLMHGVEELTVPWDSKPALLKKLKGKFDGDLSRLLAEHVMHALTEDECRLLWAKREVLASNPKALPKFLLTVNWGNHDDVREGYRLLKTWAPMPPLEALQLLSVRFPDPKVRSYAVRCMNALPDAELAAVMLQLAQVVKFERSHDTALNRFLLRRALRNPSVCGHALYWSSRRRRTSTTSTTAAACSSTSTTAAAASTG